MTHLPSENDPRMPLAPAAAPRSNAGHVGVLLANIGTPDSPAVPDVRRYLREFLWDPDVVQTNRVLWWFVLHGIVLPFRGPKSARLYQRIWTPKGSPLLVNSLVQRERLAQELGRSFHVVLGMRYGAPSLAGALDELVHAGCDRAVILPLFPQYSRSTTGSIERAVHRELERHPRPLALVNVPDWHSDSAYIRALAERTRDAASGARIEHYVMSFHGLPESTVAQGDPYRDQCFATARALARELRLRDESWSIVFQSRLGRRAWLQPYADQYVRALAARFKRVLVTTPGFAADCLETLEEICLRLRASFLAAGGEDLVVVPALNDHPTWIRGLAELVNRALENPIAARRTGGEDARAFAERDARR